MCFNTFSLFIVDLLDLNTAQNVQTIYNLNFLHRENAQFNIYNINVGSSEVAPGIQYCTWSQKKSYGTIDIEQKLASYMQKQATVKKCKTKKHTEVRTPLSIHTKLNRNM